MRHDDWLVLCWLLGLALAAAVLVLVASQRGNPPPVDDYSDYIDVEPTYADEVTGATHLFRRAAGLPALPDRQATIAELEAYLDHLKAQVRP